MRRFSQRNPLVTLSDINITPLLDLAFVLLIIFVIMSPSIRSAHEQSIQMKLPQGGQPERKFDPKDVMTVEVGPQGSYVLNGLKMSLKQIQSDLLSRSRLNPNLVVWLRADRRSTFEQPAAILDFCQERGIACSIKTEPQHP
jgi:biopolymer transport protein ExbD